MSTKNNKIKVPPPKDASRVENPLFRYHRFWLPGNAEEPPPAPVEPKELFENLNISLGMIASPRGESTEARHSHTIIGASMAAQKLIDWLFAHAIHGSESAQGQIADLAKHLTQEFVYHARKKSPGVLPRVKRWAEMPGWASRSPRVQTEMGNLCRELNQGEHFPFPLEASETARGNFKDIRIPAHALVDQLHGHIEKYRYSKHLMPWALEAVFNKEFYIDPRVSRMANLPALSTATVKDWIGISREVLNDATGDNPLTHPAFKPGGQYASLGNRDKRQEVPLWKRLAEAWRFRAKGMVRLPEDSPPRK